jgi:hypothetical protein
MSEDDEYHKDVLYFVDKEYAKKLPLFAWGILSQPYFKDEVKFKFIDKFLNRYMEDQDFHDRMVGNYIYFIDKELEGVYTGIDTSIFNVPPYRIYIVEISDESVPKLSILTSNQCTVKLNKLTNTYKKPKVNCTYKFPSYGDLSDSMLIDTGADVTTIPYLEMWDYGTSHYKDEPLSYNRYSISLAEINKDILSIVQENLEGAGGRTIYNRITFKNDIAISIEDLKPIYKRVLYVPTEPTLKQGIVGFDIISQHTMILSSTSGNVDIKFFSSEQTHESSNIIQRFESTISKVTSIFNLNS